MKVFKKGIKYIIMMCICLLSWSVFAAEQAAAKEETSPPPENGPLTAQQVPPISQA